MSKFVCDLFFPRLIQPFAEHILYEVNKTCAAITHNNSNELKFMSYSVWRCFSSVYVCFDCGFINVIQMRKESHNFFSDGIYMYTVKMIVWPNK